MHARSRRDFLRLWPLRRYELAAPSAALKKQWLEALARVTSVVPIGGEGSAADGALSPYALEGCLIKISGGSSTAKKWDTRHFRLRADGDMPVNTTNTNNTKKKQGQQSRRCARFKVCAFGVKPKLLLPFNNVYV
jgi:hypothetical protein